MIGRKIAGKFVIDAEIGNGAMGTVYRAKQVDLDKEVAIKILREPLAKEAEYSTRFKREAKAASKIDHPNSMRVLDFGQEPDGLLYIAMELLDGRNLHDIIREEGPLDTARIVDLTRQVLGALAAAHDLGILHRDLKPENIIVVRKRTDEGHEREIVKVCDFGIAKVNWGSATTTEESKLTGAGAIVGTPDYMSPEQARGVTEVDARSDLYSVGVMLYQMMTRKLPFSAHTPLGVVLMHLNEKPRPPSELAQVDPRLEAICLRAMSKDPNDRYATARDMRAALLLSDVAPESLPIAPSSKRKLALVVEQSVVTQTATTMAAPTPPVPPMRPPMSSAKEILAMEVPKRSMTPLLLVLLVVAIGGGGTYYMVRRSAQRAAAIDPPAPTVSLGTPSGTLAPVVPSGAVIKAPLASASTAASASAMASASASAATSASVGPIPPRPTDTGVAVSATASASVAPPPPGPPSPLHVVLGAVSAEHLNVATLTGALPVARFERCYREGVGANAKPPVGFAKLHIVMTSTSTEASFSGPQELATIGACVVAAANRMNIDVPSGGATADADLTFKTD